MSSRRRPHHTGKSHWHENRESRIGQGLTTHQSQAHALAKQVHDHYLPHLISHDPDSWTTEKEIALRNRLFNVDGFGVAWYTQARTDFGHTSGKWPAVYKNSQPPTNDANFHSICSNTATTACFAHIRAATTTAVTPINNHPFIFGRHTIMHNGVISDFLDIKRDMLDEIEKEAYENIHGSTDSEHFAALYMTYLAQLEHVQGKASWSNCDYSCNEMRKALLQAVMTVVSLQQKSLGQKAQANSLNVAVTDGRKMVAIRFRNHELEQPPSLYWSTEAGKPSHV
jgi:glutamine amidotransferase